MRHALTRSIQRLLAVQVTFDYFHGRNLVDFPYPSSTRPNQCPDFHAVHGKTTNNVSPKSPSSAGYKNCHVHSFTGTVNIFEHHFMVGISCSALAREVETRRRTRIPVLPTHSQISWQRHCLIRHVTSCAGLLLFTNHRSRIDFAEAEIAR